MKNNISGKISFLEPQSHTVPETKIERYWKKFSGPYSLIRSRTMRYSPYSGMTYSPVKYTPQKFILTKEYPADDWIRENFINFVRGEMDEIPHADLPQNYAPIIKNTIKFSDHNLNKFMLNSESIEEFQKADISPDSTPEEIAETVYNILCDSKTGSKANRVNNDETEFIKKIAKTIKKRERLLFIFPGMPFKDQNRFRVPFGADTPDMAEISLMKKLSNLTSALYQNHAHGADIIILSDGILYGDIFKADPRSIETYKEQLIYYRNKINSHGSVSIICLKELIDRSSEDGRAWKLTDYIIEKMQGFAADENSEATHSFKILTKGIKWNTNSRKTNPFFKEIDDVICWKFLTHDNDNEIPQVYKEHWHIFNNQVADAAYRYAAINLMLRYTNLIKNFFPDSIRATIHPKKEQFSFAGDNKTYAWNGVAWSKEWPKTIHDIKIVKFSDLPDGINQAVFEHTKLPCFFTGGYPNKNIEKARDVLPSYGWNIPDLPVNCREFTLSDLDSLIKLGRGDDFFTWEREAQTDSYFESLLQLRLNHYRRYGFGIHSVWENDCLIGQCGLQVLNEYSDEVEYVILLGKNFTGKKYGSLLTKYVIKKCKEAGMDRLLGVVHADNELGVALMKKHGGQTDKTINHYNNESVVFNLNLKQ